MEDIKPSADKFEPLCVEYTAPPCCMVVFGASGDLTRRKLLSSLYSLYKRELLSKSFFLIGCGRKEISDQEFRNLAAESIKQVYDNVDLALLDTFLDMLYYQSGQYNDSSLYKNLTAKIEKIKSETKICGCTLFYLSVPPALFEVIVSGLGNSGLAYTGVTNACQCARLIIEKPFGSDYDSAIKLNECIQQFFDESQIYRIDHYLGKETVQNIMMFRFANSIFEPLWNRNYIDSVQLTIAESLGIGHRAGYYDKSGAIRDMFQNHMLQLLALIGMDPPVSFEADRVRDEKVKLLRSLRPIDIDDWQKTVVRGQYIHGTVDGSNVHSYINEEGVDPDSKTETFLASKLYIDNWRWKGVPFYLRTGKRLKNKLSEVAIRFKQVPHSMFAPYGIDELPANDLVIRIQPQEGISLSFQAKRPGSKVCMSTLRLNFNYSEIFGSVPPEAYERLLLDCMLSDQTLFARQDAVEVTWKYITPLLEKWDSIADLPVIYPAGSESFPAADKLIEADGRKWRKLEL